MTADVIHIHYTLVQGWKAEAGAGEAWSRAWTDSVGTRAWTDGVWTWRTAT